MPSENARAVAKDVIASIRKGQKVNKGKILRKHGYSKAMSLSPTKVTTTKSYLEEIKPIVEQMEFERSEILKLLPERRGEASYRDLIDATDKLTKNIQLLSGRETESHKISVDDEKYARIIEREAKRVADSGS